LRCTNVKKTPQKPRGPKPIREAISTRTSTCRSLPMQRREPHFSGVCVLLELLEPAPQHQEAPKAPVDQPEPAALSAPPARLPTHVATDDASVESLACVFSNETDFCVVASSPARFLLQPASERQERGQRGNRRGWQAVPHACPPLLRRPRFSMYIWRTSGCRHRPASPRGGPALRKGGPLTYPATRRPLDPNTQVRESKRRVENLRHYRA
jgi:hypothetical protein